MIHHFLNNFPVYSMYNFCVDYILLFNSNGSLYNLLMWKCFNSLIVCLSPHLHETGTKSNRDNFVSVIVLFIIDVYNETFRKITETSLKSFRLLDHSSDFRTA